MMTMVGVHYLVCVCLYVSIGQSCFEKVLDPVSLRITVVIKNTYIVTKYCKILRCVKKKCSK